VSWGIKVIPTVAMTNSQGMIIATEVDNVPATGGLIASLNTSTVNIVRPLTGDELVWVSRITDDQAYDFQDIGFLNNQKYRTSLAVALFGCAASTSVAAVEYILNVEFIATPNTVGSLFPTSAAAAEPMIVDTAANVQQKMAPFFNGPIQSFNKEVEKNVDMLTGHVVNMGGNYLRDKVTRIFSQS
jgi:hypothetical protein